MDEVGDANKERVSPYRLNLVPGEEARRIQWNLIFVSDVPLTLDFYHTDMLEQVIRITGKSQDAKTNYENEVKG